MRESEGRKRAPTVYQAEFVATGMDLESAVLSEVSQTPKDKYTISLICEI